MTSTRQLPDQTNLMEELAQRCERASGPDRELDALIFHVITRETYTGFSSDGPAYTSSLDAAATLVPQGYAWRLDCWTSFTARVFAPEKKYHMWHSHISAPLALCAASLRARKGLE